MIDESRVAFKRRLGQLYAVLRARDTYRKLILLYHSVGDSARATAPEAFRKHLNIVTNTGRLVALRDLIEFGFPCGDYCRPHFR